MRKNILLAILIMTVLVGCQSNQKNDEVNKDIISVSVNQPNLKEYIEDGYGTMPDIQWNYGPAKTKWTTEERKEIMQYSNKVLSNLKVIKKIEGYEKHLEGLNISAKYRSGFQYFILPDEKEPHKAIYIGTKDNKAYKLESDEAVVNNLISWMENH
jgi:hypothetical protein